MHVRADFARAPQVPRWAWLVVAALGALAVALALTAHRLSVRTEALRAEVATLEAEAKAAARPTAPAPPPPKPYDASAREMLAQHTIPWPQVLGALEAVQITGVRVVGVDYTAADASARVEIAFAAQGQALEYVAELNTGIPPTGPAWRWTVVRIEQLRGASAGRALLLARWADR